MLYLFWLLQDTGTTQTSDPKLPTLLRKKGKRPNLGDVIHTRYNLNPSSSGEADKRSGGEKKADPRRDLQKSGVWNFSNTRAMCMNTVNL